MSDHDEGFKNSGTFHCIPEATYAKLLTLLRDELGENVDDTPLSEMLETLQSRLVDARRWRNALKAACQHLKVLNVVYLSRREIAAHVQEAVTDMEGALNAQADSEG